MTSRDSILAKLLNAETFVRWLKEEASEQQTCKWDHWMTEDPQNSILVKKAKKIISMPFLEEGSTDMQEEARRLDQSLKDLE